MRKIALSVIILSTPAIEAWAEEKEVQTQVVSTTQSAPSTTLQTSMATGMALNTRNKISGAISVGYSSNLYERNAYKSEVTTSAEMVLNYKISGSHFLRTYTAVSQDQSRGRETSLKDGYLAWTNDKFWHQDKVSSVGQHVRLIVPASRESRLRDERLTGVTVAPIAILNLTPVGLTGVMIAYQPAVTKNFHKYEQNRAFRSNNEYTLSQLIRIAWSFTERAYFLSDFVYRSAWSYGGIKKDDSSTYSVELGYTFKNALTWAAGVTTDATIRNFENGTDESISLFNQQTSSVFTELSYVF